MSRTDAGAPARGRAPCLRRARASRAVGGGAAEMLREACGGAGDALSKDGFTGLMESN